MEDFKIARRVAEWNPQEDRSPGRPVNIWKDGIRDSRQRRNIKVKNVSMEDSGRKKKYLWVEQNCVFTEFFPVITIQFLRSDLYSLGFAGLMRPTIFPQ